MRDQALARPIWQVDRTAAMHESGGPDEHVALICQKALHRKAGPCGLCVQTVGKLMNLRAVALRPQVPAAKEVVWQGVASGIVFQLSRTRADVLEGDP